MCVCERERERDRGREGGRERAMACEYIRTAVVCALEIYSDTHSETGREKQCALPETSVWLSTKDAHFLECVA